MLMNYWTTRNETINRSFKRNVSNSCGRSNTNSTFDWEIQKVFGKIIEEKMFQFEIYQLFLKHLADYWKSDIRYRCVN